MSQTFSGYSPTQNKQKSSYQHGSKNEQVSRYRLTFMCWYPFEYHVRCSKCWPFAATNPLRRPIMDSLPRCRWYGYSRSSCSILRTVLWWTPSAEDILRVLVPAVRGLPPSITGMNVPLSRRRCAMRENVQLHGSRRFGYVSWYRCLASCALPLARP